MKIIILNGSSRPEGNTDSMVTAYKAGAEDDLYYQAYPKKSHDYWTTLDQKIREHVSREGMLYVCDDDLHRAPLVSFRRSAIISFMKWYGNLYRKDNRIMDNQLFELAVRRRSVRRYTDDHIDNAVIDEIMKVALTAPASFGHQPVEFVVVRDKQTIKDIADCKSLGGNQSIGADAVIVVMVKLDRGEFWIEDGAIASSYILLAAEQYDVGACWVHIRNRRGKRKSSDEEIRELLGVPDNYAVLNLIALGGKGEQKQGYTEADFEKRKVHFERY